MKNEKPHIKNVLAENLRILMERNPGLDSQPKLASKSGIGQSTIGRILRAEVSTTIDIVEAIANVFGLTAAEILTPRTSSVGHTDNLSRVIAVFRSLPLANQEQYANLIESHAASLSLPALKPNGSLPVGKTVDRKRRA
jgi:transcriptional regulator with XRE-family HTH domain